MSRAYILHLKPAMRKVMIVQDTVARAKELLLPVANPPPPPTSILLEQFATEGEHFGC